MTEQPPLRDRIAALFGETHEDWVSAYADADTVLPLIEAELAAEKAEQAEAAIARVRELCAKRTAESRTPHIAVNVSEVLRALDGDR